MSAKMQAMLTKVPQTLGDSYFVLDLVTGNPRQKNGKERLMAQPAKRRTGEIDKTHQRTQGPITGKPKKRAGREWYNPTIKNRTQMNADYPGKNEPVNPRKSVSRQKTENREPGKEKPHR